MPFGYLFTVALIGVCTLLQLLRQPRPRPVRQAAFYTSMLVNEQPHWVAAMLIASTVLAFAQGDVETGAGRAVVVLAALVLVGLIVLFVRMFKSRPPLVEALAKLQPRTGPGPGAPARATIAALALPFALGRTRTRRTGAVSYGPAGKWNLLDLYLPRKGEVTGPTLIYLHGGGFTSGSRRREGQFALNRLAARGWACISASYRLSPAGQFPDYVIDLKRVIAWARSEGARLGADPDRILLAGSSAGGHTCACAALTINDRSLQPGFEEVDTTVDGVVGLYGYYGGLGYERLKPRGPLPSSPVDLVHPDAPPFLLVHGDRDTVVPPEYARRFAGRLADAGVPVALAELPGAQHTFDLLRSVRNENTTEAVEAFAGTLRSGL